MTAWDRWWGSLQSRWTSAPAPAVGHRGRPTRASGGGAARPPVDLLVLAQDRRWQSIDTIRVMKDLIGTGLMTGGMIYGMQHDSRPEIVLAALLGGALLKASSQADLRHWEMLPRTTYVLLLTLPPGTHDVTVNFPDVPGVRQTWARDRRPAGGRRGDLLLANAAVEQRPLPVAAARPRPP